jgi:hypothetical protein
MDELAASFPTDAQRESWKAVRPLFGELEEAHKALLALINTPAQYPALTTYEKMVTPQLQPLETALTELVTREIQNPQVNERLLAAAVGLQASILSAVRDLRGYVHRGQDAEKAQFEQAWNKVNERLKTIVDMGSTMPPEQMRVLNRVRVGVISIRRGATLVINERIGPTWNAPMSHLTDRVAPISEKILTALQGPLTPGGERKGGLIDGQTAQLTADTTAAADMAQSAVDHPDDRRRPVGAGRPRHRLPAGADDRHPDRRHDGRHAAPVGGCPRHGDSRPRPPRRDRRHGRRHGGLPRHHGGRRGGPRGAGRGAGGRGRAPRPPQCRGRGLRRPHERAGRDLHRLFGPGGGFGAQPRRHRRGDHPPGRRGRGRRRDGLDERADRGRLHRGTRRIGPRDQRPGGALLGQRREGRGRRPCHGRPDPQPRRRRRPHRRRHQPDQGHRRPDQPAGAQCHHRGGARGRCWAEALPLLHRR